MKRPTLVAALAAILTLLAAVTALARTNALAGLLNPIVVTIDQAIPVTLTLADSAGLTTTVPLTVGVNLAITLDGAQLVDVAAGASKPAVAVAQGLANPSVVDNSGIPYTAEAPIGYVVEQMVAIAMFDVTQISGEVTNNTGKKPPIPMVAVTVYDSKGKMLLTTMGFFSADLEPGATAPFTALVNLPINEIGSYKLQVQP